MAQQQFRLERVLNWKSKQEKLKKLEKSILEREMKERSREIEQCLSMIDDLAQTALDKVGSGVMVRDMIVLSSNLRSISQTIHTLQLDLKALMNKIGSLNTEILEVRQMKKVLEKLQEKFRLDEMKEELKREIKFLDEVGARQKGTRE